MTGLVDAPVIRLDRLSPAQRAGRSCAWCSFWADPRYRVPLLQDVAVLRACETCAGTYGITPVEDDHD
ncbi:hypothetical protein [Streptomyces sp. NPDC000410]|uniref:hypothetical protein n=1 Tax=Streptomyces sp. NPDC000410 TaxID=3154254 RepID=UPI0033342A22